jgi:hypothetical protein
VPDEVDDMVARDQVYKVSVARIGRMLNDGPGFNCDDDDLL